MGGHSRFASPDGLVQLVATTSQTAVLAGVANKIVILVELVTGKDETVERPNYDLAMVLVSRQEEERGSDFFSD